MTGQEYQRCTGNRRCPACFRGKLDDDGICPECKVGVATEPPVFSDAGAAPLSQTDLYEHNYARTREDKAA